MINFRPQIDVDLWSNLGWKILSQLTLLILSKLIFNVHFKFARHLLFSILQWIRLKNNISPDSSYKETWSFVLIQFVIMYLQYSPHYVTSLPQRLPKCWVDRGIDIVIDRTRLVSTRLYSRQMNRHGSAQSSNRMSSRQRDRYSNRQVSTRHCDWQINRYNNRQGARKMSSWLSDGLTPRHWTINMYIGWVKS